MGCGGDPPSPWCLLPLNLNDVEELSVFLDVIHAGNVSLRVLTRAQERQMYLEETDDPDVVVKSLNDVSDVVVNYDDVSYSYIDPVEESGRDVALEPRQTWLRLLRWWTRI